MASKKKKSAKINYKEILVKALADTLVGTLLIIIEKVLR